MRILSVDDKPDNLLLIESVARAYGHETVSAQNGLDALAELRKQEFDLIVSDILMPDMDGFRFCREVKTNPSFRHIPFVFYTATYTSQKDHDLGLSLGASRFIIKPQEPAQFIAMLEAVLAEGTAGELRTPPVSLAEEDDYLRSYNHRLIAKLERKIEQLESASAERRRAEEWLRLVWENALDAMCLTDADGVIDRVNPGFTRLFGKSATEAEGQPISCCYSNGTAGAALETHARRFAARGAATFEEMIIGWDSRPRWIEGSSAFIDSSAGPRMLTVFRDISERQRIQQERADLALQMQHTQKLESLGRLAGGIAHDFNNLLTVITGYTDLCLQSESLGNANRTYLNEINRASRQSIELVKQLLAFARKPMAEVRRVDLSAIVSSAAGLILPLVGENIQVSIHAEPAACWILADENQLRHVLVNLVVNARDAMPGGGTISIRVRLEPSAEEPKRVSLLVSDTGIGMDAATRAKIFEPFFTTKGEGKGTGLGLSTVHGIVHRFGGSIDVTSEPGRGTAFILVFPYSAEEEVSRADDADAGSKSPLGGTETILVVDDNSAVRDLTINALKKYGYRVLDASDGHAALRLSESYTGPIHLLLSDVRMPGMTGPELVGRLAVLRPRTPAILMSGSIAEESGEYPQLLKPASPAELAAKVREVLDAYRHGMASGG